MKVQELIEALEKYPRDANVYASHMGDLIEPTNLVIVTQDIPKSYSGELVPSWYTHPRNIVLRQGAIMPCPCKEKQDVQPGCVCTHFYKNGKYTDCRCDYSCRTCFPNK